MQTLCRFRYGFQTGERNGAEKKSFVCSDEEIRLAGAETGVLRPEIAPEGAEVGPGAHLSPGPGR